MTDGISIKSQVDSSLLDRVEQECYQMLYQQRLFYNERWYSSFLLVKTLSVLRLTGLLLSIVGVILCLFYLVYPSTCPKWFFAEAYLLFFILAGVLFYYLPRVETRFLGRLKKAGGNSCKRMARRLIAKARKLLPFEAEYDIKGDLITYYRGKDNERQQAWSRQIGGFAILGENVTLLFRKPTSLLPKMLILYEDIESMEPVLKNLDIAYKAIVSDVQDKQSGSE